MKKIALLGAMMAMSLAMNPPYASIVVDEPKRGNDRKKCFRKSCDNSRTGNKLYCSSECCKLDKINP